MKYDGWQKNIKEDLWVKGNLKYKQKKLKDAHTAQTVSSESDTRAWPKVNLLVANNVTISILFHIYK